MKMKEYDLICSLGGNCAAAHNLLYRGLRLFSLPFDWCYIENEKPIYKLAECFRDDFLNFCLKNNLKLLNNGVNPAHKEKIQYIDEFSEYIFPNHFDKYIEDGGYEPFKLKMDRRIKRLYKNIQDGNKILFIISTNFDLDLDCVKFLKKTLNKKWENKKFDFLVISFNCNEDIDFCENKIQVQKHIRPMNDYDFTQTNNEWAILDDIEINKNIIGIDNYILRFKKIKKGISVYLFGQISTLLRFRFYLFGLRIDFCIGKVRD
jgi:hypothetical protein